jgi:putative transcriptional regulator
LLRDLRESARTLILYELATRPYRGMKEIADRLGVTVAAVSEHLRSMAGDGLVSTAGRSYRATQKGVQSLHERFAELRGFIDEAAHRMSVVSVTAAVAGARVRVGDSVGLFMERGELVAYPGRGSSSTGRALTDAEKGEDIGVTNLEGIVGLEPGTLDIVEVPGVRRGGSRALPLKEVQALLGKKKPDVVWVVGVEARVAAERLKLEGHLSFAAAEGAVEACHRGLRVLVIASADRAAELVSRIEGENAEGAGQVKCRLHRFS